MSERRSIGLIVNPVAGMGGRVGLKGTDGDAYERACRLGAQPVSPRRTAMFLAALDAPGEIDWLTAPAAMGADVIDEAGLEARVVGDVGGRSEAADTRAIAGSMRDEGADLIVFAGGDGTARDMLDALGQSLPVVAIPAGVKIYSSVFAVSAAAAADLLQAFIDGTELGEEEVLDIDEDAYREGRVESRHYGYLLVPEVERLLQAGKQASDASASTSASRLELATAVIEAMETDTLYLLGCGTTIGAVAEQLGVSKTLLGIDAVRNGKLVGHDLNEQAILELMARHERVRLIVTPLGGNGFIFGRGNKQLSAQVLKRISRERIAVIAGRDKLMNLDCLRVDTGDPELDRDLAGYIDVLVGRGHKKLMRIA